MDVTPLSKTWHDEAYRELTCFKANSGIQSDCHNAEVLDRCVTHDISYHFGDQVWHVTPGAVNKWNLIPILH